MSACWRKDRQVLSTPTIYNDPPILALEIFLDTLLVLLTWVLYLLSLVESLSILFEFHHFLCPPPPKYLLSPSYLIEWQTQLYLTPASGR